MLLLDPTLTLANTEDLVGGIMDYFATLESLAELVTGYALINSYLGISS